MPIVVGLAVLVALIYGAVWSFHALSAQFGLGVAIGVAVVVAALLIAGALYWLHRRKEIAPNIPRGQDGDWTHELKQDWGGVRLAADKRLCDLRIGDERGSYIFADLRGARMEPGANGGWQVLLDVKDPKHAEWRLPMKERSDALRWTRILTRAVEQRL